MSLANDMTNLRREIDELRNGRAALRRRLSHFATDLAHSMARQRADFRHKHGEETAHMKAMLSDFAANCTKTIGHMLREFRRENTAARHAFFGRHKKHS